MNPAVIIPAFNEEARVQGVVAGVRRHVAKVIVVDDGSTDGTADAAARAGAEVVRHPRNLGKGAAIRSGLRKAFEEGFDPAIILDADGQHECEEIPQFLRTARDQRADIVVGNRMGDTEGMPLVRYLTNRLTSFFVSRLAGREIPDSQCGYRLISRRAFETMRFRTAGFDTESEMLIDAGRADMRIASVGVKTIYGTERSKINPFRDTLRFFKLMFRYVGKPAGKSYPHP